MAGFLLLVTALAVAVTAFVPRLRGRRRAAAAAAAAALAALALGWFLRPSFLLLRKLVALAAMPSVLLWIGLAAFPPTPSRPSPSR